MCRPPTPAPLPKSRQNSTACWPGFGEGLTGRELDAVKPGPSKYAVPTSWADRSCAAQAPSSPAGISAPGRADVLVLDRFTPSTSFELSDYRRWLQDARAFARHGTPVWSTVPTEPALNLVSQIDALSAKPVSILAGTEQTRLVAYTALGSGAGR